MQLYPAIDLKGGQCVRLTQGRFDAAKVYSADPVQVAEHWKSQGASWLHLVDLDGALAGYSINEDALPWSAAYFTALAFAVCGEVK